MTNMLGNSRIIIADSDALIGLINENDALHEKCLKIAGFLKQNNFLIFTSLATVLEAATALSHDKTIKRPDLAKKLFIEFSKLEKPDLKEIGENIIQFLASVYDAKTSKRNSPFDFYILSLAKENNVKYIFSFDKFYEKNGLILAEKLLGSDFYV